MLTTTKCLQHLVERVQNYRQSHRRRSVAENMAAYLNMAYLFEFKHLEYKCRVNDNFFAVQRLLCIGDVI